MGMNGNDLELLMRFYTMNDFHYRHLLPLTKRTVNITLLNGNALK